MSEEIKLTPQKYIKYFKKLKNSRVEDVYISPEATLNLVLSHPKHTKKKFLLTIKGEWTLSKRPDEEELSYMFKEEDEPLYLKRLSTIAARLKKQAKVLEYVDISEKNSWRSGLAFRSGHMLFISISANGLLNLKDMSSDELIYASSDTPDSLLNLYRILQKK
jgi:hypothetical protein